MAQNFSLQATTRNITGKKVAGLREQGITPAVVYGHGKDTASIQVDQAALEKVYSQAGRGSLIDLTVDNQAAIPVVIQSLSRNRMSDVVEHVDLHAVRMDQEITSEVVLVFTGESMAVKSQGGTLVKNKDHITIKCLPSKLIKELTIDISPLATFEDSIKVSSLQLPDGIQVMDQADDMIALVAAPRSDEELAALNESVTEDVSKVQGVIKETPADDKDKAAKKE